MPTCVYCLVTTPDPEYRKREHVMPQAFGLFKPDNLLLRKEVCEKCNAYFGNELEIKGTRASVEGIHRFTAAKLMGPDSFLKMPKGRVRWELEEPGWEKLRTHFQKGEDGEVEMHFRAQVIVTYEDGSKKTFFPEEITDISQFDKAKGYRACIVSLEDAEIVKAALARVGITPSWGEIKEVPPDNGTNMASATAYVVYDDITRRLMAKIVFNYLAYRVGGPFALKPEFDAIRRFIRYGEGKGEELVANTDEAFLQEEKGAGGWYLTDDHLVGVRPNLENGFLGDIAIFNLIHYHVVLSRTGPQMDLLAEKSFGHAFSWRTNTLKPLLAWDEENIVQPFSVLAQRYAKRKGWRRR